MPDPLRLPRIETVVAKADRSQECARYVAMISRRECLVTVWKSLPDGVFDDQRSLRAPNLADRRRFLSENSPNWHRVHVLRFPALEPGVRACTDSIGSLTRSMSPLERNRSLQ